MAKKEIQCEYVAWYLPPVGKYDVIFSGAAPGMSYNESHKKVCANSQNDKRWNVLLPSKIPLDITRPPLIGFENACKPTGVCNRSDHCLRECEKDSITAWESVT
jgi:hypothetical protein